jgi:hypothetical protein
MQLQTRASSEAGTLPTIVNPIPDAHPCREGGGAQSWCMAQERLYQDTKLPLRS